MKIIFCDLAYLKDDEFVHPYPLNVGYIVAYFIQYHSDVEVEIFKDPHKLLERLKTSEFDMICFSNYDWNYNLNRYILEKAKNLNNDLICIMGGPNIDEKNDDNAKLIFQHYQYVDFYIVGAGEELFEQLFKELKLVNFVKKNLDISLLSINLLSYNESNNCINRGIQKSVYSDLKTLPSPYLTGIMDPFLKDNNLVPMIETNRGCPYSCAFCCWGSATKSKIREFSLDTVIKEIEYIAKNTKNTTKTLYIADGNFGILKRDIKIAEKIIQMKQTNAFPLNVFMYFAKNTDSTIVKIAEILQGLVEFNMSKQTLNAEVLSNIGRKNISDTEYDKRILELKDVNTNSQCELIYGLPGESYKSFVDGARTMAKKGYKLTFYSLLLIKGAEVSSSKYRERFGIKSGYRIIPRYCGQFDDDYIFECEEICLETNVFSKDDFFKLRLVQYFYSIFKERFFVPIVKFLSTYNVDLISLIDELIAQLDKLPSSIVNNIKEFNEAARLEIIDKDNLKTKYSQEEALQFTNAKALNVYYFCKLIAKNHELLEFKEYLKILLFRVIDNNDNTIMSNLNLLLDICFDRIPNFENINSNTIFSYDSWPNELNSYLDFENNLDNVNNLTIKLNFHYSEDTLEIFSKNFNKSSDLCDAIYKTRVGLIASSYRAYTYDVSVSS